jgi:hypothetical protein
LLQESLIARIASAKKNNGALLHQEFYWSEHFMGEPSNVQTKSLGELANVDYKLA